MKNALWWVTFLGFLLFVVCGHLAHAQPAPKVYELACPAGYSPAPFGESFNSVTGQWRANFCRNDSGTGRWVCQADGCSGNVAPGPGVPSSRSILTASPVNGGGDLTTNRTIGLTVPECLDVGLNHLTYAHTVGTTGPGTFGCSTREPTRYYQFLKYGVDAGTLMTQRPTLHLTPGANIAIACADDSGALESNCTFAATGIPAAQQQSDWAESNAGLPDFIKNKPTIPAAQVNSDWNAVSGVAQILNKPTIPHGISFTVGTVGGSAITAGSNATDFVTVPFACTVSGYSLVVDTGTVTVKFWKIATGTAAPTSGNAINTSGVGISTGTKKDSATLTDFTSTAVSKNDTVAMNVTAATAGYVNGVLECDQSQ